MNDMSPKLQNQLSQYQQLQQQIQVLSSQRYQLEAQSREVAKAIEELNGMQADAAIYKNVGALMIKAKDRESGLKVVTEE